MDVTRANFDVVLDEFLALLKTCSFYAVDQEMTGIESTIEKRRKDMDTAELYGPGREAASRYCPFQIGICLFHESEGGAYVARPFNFYLCNHKDVTLNRSAVDFLLSNGMNFQKWLSEGLTFADEEKEQSERLRIFPLDTSDDLSPEERDWVQCMFQRVKQWRDGVQQKEGEPQTLEVDGNEHLSTAADIALHHKLLKSELWVSAQPPLDCRIPPWKRTTTVYRPLFTAEEVRKAAADIKVKRERDFLRATGFRTVFKALVDSKKLQIGHNYNSDLEFMLHSHDRALPLAYSAFRERVHELFPAIYDTKVLAAQIPITAKPFASTALEPLFKELGKNAEVKVSLPLGFQSYHPLCVALSSDKSHAHQGAYDAYMTGIVYLQLQKKFGSEHTQQFLNKIAIFGTFYYMDLNLSGPAPDRFAPYCVPLYLTSSKIFHQKLAEILLADESQLAELERPEKTRAELNFRVSFIDNVSAVALYLRTPLSTADLIDRIEQHKKSEKHLAAAGIKADLLQQIAVIPFDNHKARQKRCPQRSFREDEPPQKQARVQTV